MIEIASQMIICLIIASFLGFLIGFFIGKVSANKKNFVRNNIKSQTGNVSGNIYNKPLIRSLPRPRGKDNLQEIEGIDESLEDKLNELGIFHFDQIAKWSEKNFEWVIEHFSLDEEKIKEEKWIEQAKEFSKI